jgi:branched-chain amino acid transport system substrate-binding protein
MRARAVLVLLAGVALTLGGGCRGSTAKPVRIGILSDCYGPFSSAHQLFVASAELPLIERGGKLRGRSPSGGVEGASVGGRPVELLVGCVSGTENVLPEARRLVEEEGARVLVGPLVPEHGLVLRAYARRRPDTTFLIQPSGTPELTLTNPAPNVFRFAADYAQSAAGLGWYAYHELGWRTAATVAVDSPYGWGNVAGFVAEFCAVGGRMVDRQWIQLAANPADIVPRIPPSADGVYLGATLSPMLGFMKGYSALHHDLSRRLLASAALLYDPAVVARARGLVAGGGLPFQPTAAEHAYVAAFAKAFPTIPAASALGPAAVSYRDGVEAALEALERVHGTGGARFMTALAHVQLRSPAGRIRLDGHRQAVVPNYLSRVVADAERRPSIKTIRVVPNVEQTFGGLLEPGDPPPSETGPGCKRGNPPPWTR